MANPEKKKVEDKKVEAVEVEKPKAEEPKKVEKPKAEKKKEIVHKIDGRKFGSKYSPLIIESVSDYELNGRQYKKIISLDGQVFILSEKDLDNQIIKG